MNDEVFFQVRYTVTVGERDDLLRDLAQLRMAESSRAEQGCLQYEYLLPVDAPDQVLLLERWSSSEAQQAHTGTAHFAKLADVKQRYGLSTKVVRLSMDEPAYFDMHCHLGFCEDAVQAARALAAAGVGAFSNTVTPVEFAEQRVALAGAGNVRTGAGLHPWWVGGYDVAANWDRLYGLVARTRFVGEVGLDFSSAHIATRKAQVDALACVAHACARTGDKVLSVHAVRAVDQVLDVLEGASVFGGMVGNACIIHWFSGTSDQLTRARRVGCYFSVNPRMLQSKRGRAYARAIPVDRLLLETDEPASAGAPWSAARVRKLLEETLAQLAALRGDDPAELRERIAQTSRTLLQQ